MVVVGAVGDSGLLKLVKGFGLNLIDTRSDCARKEAVQGMKLNELTEPVDRTEVFFLHVPKLLTRLPAPLPHPLVHREITAVHPSS